MSPASTARITLELEIGADPIRGSIDHAGGSRQHFWGWLELIEELRRVAAGEPEQHHESRGTNAAGRPQKNARDTVPTRRRRNLDANNKDD